MLRDRVWEKVRDLLIATWYWANIKSWATLLVNLNTDVKISGRRNLPQKEPYILVCNHLNVADPPILIT